MIRRERATLVIRDDFATGMRDAVELVDSTPIRPGESVVCYLRRLLGGAA